VLEKLVKKIEVDESSSLVDQMDVDAEEVEEKDLSSSFNEKRRRRRRGDSCCVPDNEEDQRPKVISVSWCASVIIIDVKSAVDEEN